MNMAVDSVGVRQPRLWLALAVNQLEDTEDLALAVLHRQCDQGARAVSRLLVERRIEMEGPGLWDAVGISQLDDLAMKGAVACHRSFRDGKRVFRVRKLHAVVLGQPEAQPRRDVRTASSVRSTTVQIGAGLLHQVEGARIGAGYLPGFR